jgi:lysophospholipid hydrolase
MIVENSEFGQGESVGEMEVLTNSKRASTIHAIRDTEVAIMPSTLFNALSLRHPEITIAIARIIASRSQEKSTLRREKLNDGLESGNNNINLKTVAIIPVTGSVPVLEFSERLRDALGIIGASITLLNTESVTSQLGKHAFTRIGRLKLLSWLAEQEEFHRLVLYVADGGINSPWTQRCVRQADCILLIGLGDDDPGIGEFERLLIGMKTTARKELVLLHAERQCIPGSTSQWMKNRLWIHAVHHVRKSI